VQKERSDDWGKGTAKEAPLCISPAFGVRKASRKMTSIGACGDLGYIVGLSCGVELGLAHRAHRIKPNEKKRRGVA